MVGVAFWILMLGIAYTIISTGLIFLFTGLISDVIFYIGLLASIIVSPLGILEFMGISADILQNKPLLLIVGLLTWFTIGSVIGARLSKTKR